MISPMGSPFTPKTLAFLRALKRHNDREWFRERKADYAQHVHAPMVAILERLADDFRVFAPELIADPKVSLFRIYRDTRFSDDKSPLKTAIGARFPARGFAKGRGAGLYFEIAPGWVWIGGGLYRPEPADLTAIRERIAASHPRLRTLTTTRTFASVLGPLQGERLSRVPRGYPADHPAAEFLRFKQFLGFKEYDARFATTDAFYPELLTVFGALMPLVRFLNDAMRASSPPAVPFGDLAPRGRRAPR